jgi:hypothetical protein
MNDVVYRIVEHDGGWAYKLGDVFSETFPTRADAEGAAERVAAEQRTPGEDAAISWQDEAGRWHDEMGRGSDRPDASVAHDIGVEAPGLTGSRGVGRASVDQIRGVYDRGDHYARHGLSLVRRQTRGQPLAAVVLAGLCGYGLALLLRRRD